MQNIDYTFFKTAMRMTRKLHQTTFSMLKMLIIFISIIIPSTPTKANTTSFFEQIIFTDYNNEFYAYNMVLPILLSYRFLYSGDSLDYNTEKTIRYINFYSTPGMYEDLSSFRIEHELPQRIQNSRYLFLDLSLLLSTGNMLCTDQAYMASFMLDRFIATVHYRDITGHSFVEININNRWIIVDPMFDMRLRNSAGQLFDFDDALVALDTLSKQSASTSNKSTYDYLQKYNASTYVPVRHKYNEPLSYKTRPIPCLLDQTFSNIANKLKLEGIDIHKQISSEYLYYIMCRVANYLQASADPAQEAIQIQKLFLKRLGAMFSSNYPIDLVFLARNLQLMGLYDEALNLFINSPQTDKILFFESQIYCAKGDKNEYNTLKNKLGDNIFYRYNYWLLNKAYLRPDDPIEFGKFKYKRFDLDLSSPDVNPYYFLSPLEQSPHFLNSESILLNHFCRTKSLLLSQFISKKRSETILKQSTFAGKPICHRLATSETVATCSFLTWAGILSLSARQPFTLICFPDLRQGLPMLFDLAYLAVGKWQSAVLTEC